MNNTVIKENPDVLLTSDSTIRFSSAPWFEDIQKQDVILAGVGGIGSYVAFLLSRLNINKLILFDFDNVESCNLSGQLYGKSHIGEGKVTAIGKIIEEFCETKQVFSIKEPYSPNSIASKIMICGFDNMHARETFFRNWKRFVEGLPENERNQCLFIDGRLSAETLQVFAFSGDDTYNIDRYSKEFLFGDSEGVETVCSYKQTTYMANMIGSFITNLFVNFIYNLSDNIIKRSIPFYTEYKGEFMQLIQES